MLRLEQADCMGKRGYPAEFWQRVLDLIAAGRAVRDVAADLGISEKTVYGWRRQARTDQGIALGLTSGEQAELAAARRRMRELEAEFAIQPGPPRC
jgi:transposase-like protein